MADDKTAAEDFDSFLRETFPNDWIGIREEVRLAERSRSGQSIYERAFADGARRLAAVRRVAPDRAAALLAIRRNPDSAVDALDALIALGWGARSVAPDQETHEKLREVVAGDVLGGWNEHHCIENQGCVICAGNRAVDAVLASGVLDVPAEGGEQ